MVVLIVFGHKLHIGGHEKEPGAENMPRKHIHDRRLPVRRGSSARSHFVQVETDDLRVAQIEPGRFLQDDIRFNGV